VLRQSPARKPPRRMRPRDRAAAECPNLCGRAAPVRPVRHCEGRLRNRRLSRSDGNEEQSDDDEDDPRGHGIVNELVLVTVPAGTVTLSGPESAPTGTDVVIWMSESTVNVASVVSNWT
jgi:hypothetical protein